MKGYIMNYIQSFRPNGLSNANGSIHVANPIWLQYYDFTCSEWKRSEDGFIALDENGVSNKLWKYSMGGNIVVKDQAGTEIFNYTSPSDWDDEGFKKSLESFNVALNDLLASANFKKIYLSKHLFNADERNYVAILNDTNESKTVIIKNSLGSQLSLSLEPQLMFVGYVNSNGHFIEL
ncbi:MAG: hypothetical protein LBC75_02655 [Fibromonadaceae bacterium]|jgi:hypothetical protein|nr:hypothetical protein [Fibromonadaceae bacterium]